MNQKDGVYGAVVAVLNGEINGKVNLTDAQIDQVEALVIHGFMAGQIDYKGGCPNEVALKKYVPGLVNNWLRKDTRLTGGMKYETKRPGSRAGAGDESLKAMRGLKTLLESQPNPDTEQIALVEAAIAERQAELKPSLEIKVDALPEHLRRFAPVKAVPPMVRKAE